MVQADIRVSFMAAREIGESQGSIRILPQSAPFWKGRRQPVPLRPIGFAS
jgi:hypothetical protein